MKSNKMLYAGFLVILTMSDVASAQLGGLVSTLRGKDDAASSSVSAEELVQSYSQGAASVQEANHYLLLAVGLKEEAATAAETAKNLTQGATESGLEDAAAVQTEASKALSEKILEENLTLDAEGKKNYALGLLNLAVGIKQYSVVSSQIAGFKPSLTSIGSSAASAAFIVKNVPGSTVQLMTTLKDAVAFAKKAGVEIPEEATSLL